MARLTVPCARRGATRASQRARPGAATGRPRSLPTSTRSADGARRDWGARRLESRRRDGPSGAMSVAIRRPDHVLNLSASAAGGIRVISHHDLPYQLVAHDIPLVEADERDPLDSTYHADRLHQTGCSADRQVDLRDISRDHRLGPEPQA